MPKAESPWGVRRAYLSPTALGLIHAMGARGTGGMLLASRPVAQAVAVEIDPRMNRRVRRHIPRAGATIERTGNAAQHGDGNGEGRLKIVHAEGRVI